MSDKVWTWEELDGTEQAVMRSKFPVKLEHVMTHWRELEHKGLVRIIRIDHRHSEIHLTVTGRLLTDATTTPAASEPTREGEAPVKVGLANEIIKEGLEALSRAHARNAQLKAENARLQERLQAAEAALKIAQGVLLTIKDYPLVEKGMSESHQVAGMVAQADNGLDMIAEAISQTL